MASSVDLCRCTVCWPVASSTVTHMGSPGLRRVPTCIRGRGWVGSSLCYDHRTATHTRALSGAYKYKVVYVRFGFGCGSAAITSGRPSASSDLAKRSAFSSASSASGGRRLPIDHNKMISGHERVGDWVKIVWGDGRARYRREMSARYAEIGARYAEIRARYARDTREICARYMQGSSPNL